MEDEQAYPFWSPAELRALAERVIARLEPDSGPDGDEGERLYEEDHDRWKAVHEELITALGALGAVAVTTGDVGLVPDLARWLDVAAGYDPDPMALTEELARALERSARPALPVDERARRLAADGRPRIRAAVAKVLDLTEPAGQAIVGRLVEDPDPAVQRAARARLAEVCDVRWWHGRFPRDPFEGADDVEQARRRPLVEAVVAWFEEPAWAQRAGLADMLSALDGLPDELALPVLVKCLRNAEVSRFDGLGLIAPRLLRRPGGPEAFAREYADPDETVFLFGPDDWLAQVPGAERRAAAVAVAHLTPPSRLDDGSRAEVASAVSRLWPAGDDPAALADWYSELVEADGDGTAARVAARLFAAAGVPLPAAAAGWGDEE